MRRLIAAAVLMTSLGVGAWGTFGRADSCCAGEDGLAKCVGKDPCPACKTCKKCGHCAAGGKCGACK